MALIFGRFDRADEKVREAVLELASLVKPKRPKEGEKGEADYEKDQMLNFHRSAHRLFVYALEREPDVTISDLGKCILTLGQEAKDLGHLGPHSKPYLAHWRFNVFWHPRRKNGGKPVDEEASMTLAEASALMHANAKSRQGDAR